MTWQPIAAELTVAPQSANAVDATDWYISNIRHVILHSIFLLTDKCQALPLVQSHLIPEPFKESRVVINVRQNEQAN